MQHHGVPTRLLDWTENALAGLFFAVNKHPSKDGSIYILLPVVLNRYSNIKPKLSIDIPSFEDDELINYSTKSLTGEKTSSLKPIAVLVPRTNPRMQAQLGVFTIIHHQPTPIENVGRGDHVFRYIIPASAKRKIRRELRHLGINKFSLFPELASIGEIISEEL